MSSHADTIRESIRAICSPNAHCRELRDRTVLRVDAMEDEIQQLREEIRLREESQIPVIPHGAQAKMERLEAENQQLRDALEQIVESAIATDDAQQIARRTLAAVRVEERP